VVGQSTKEIHMAEITTTEIYTDEQATDEAVLLLTRRLRRLHPEVHASLMASFPEGVREALDMADNRADLLRHNDKQADITRRYVSLDERLGVVEEDEPECICNDSNLPARKDCTYCYPV
jgi:hypothetical protein